MVAPGIFSFPGGDFDLVSAEQAQSRLKPSQNIHHGGTEKNHFAADLAQIRADPKNIENMNHFDQRNICGHQRQEQLLVFLQGSVSPWQVLVFTHHGHCARRALDDESQRRGLLFAPPHIQR
jgi:hypothetical protein